MVVDHSNLQGSASTVDTNGSGILHWEDGNINSDPLFHDPDNDDFSLQSGSPCIDMGTAFLDWDLEIVIDMTEDEYDDYAPDMGAVEYQTSVSNDLSKLPHTVSLEPAYPNPFNPITTIKYDVPTDSYVTITIYDLMGRRVNELMSERVSSGTHSVIWNGTDASNNPVASGMYLYQLKSSDFVETRKLVLLK